ncbi:alpha/beta hydrolase fold protein [Fictibacillus macauensis ZFHKF-1]|uniref:Alpha/beta hydrolase fold protein n=1 Tax=Fictibacillus macauensis ZFHKF-1 TaxID=1196324 RepID=I8UHX7_9BACL|nr:alpha/beta hydrolase [Fictibacillus macauensis]EIT86475.1 alpha/beta hydrolase fold protein [Fictibacillus macauensis ZFHKF-1]
MPTIQVNGIQLYYEECGQGEPVLLLHGLGGDQQTMEIEKEALQAHYRVIALDARGHGCSQKPAQFTLSDLIQDVIAFMDALHLAKASLLGVSMGSYIAQGVASEVPERIEKLILVVTKSYSQSSSIAELIEQHKETLHDIPQEEVMNHLVPYIYHDVKKVMEWAMKIEPQVYVWSEIERQAAQNAITHFDFRTVLSRVTATTLVISGKHDGLNPPHYGRETAHLIQGAQFVEFEHSGHAPSAEERETYTKCLQSFLTQEVVLSEERLERR